MTHDPLCDWQQKQCEDNCAAASIGDHCSHMWCQCELIAKVREDEREQESARRAAKFGYWHDYRPDPP